MPPPRPPVALPPPSSLPHPPRPPHEIRKMIKEHPIAIGLGVPTIATFVFGIALHVLGMPLTVIFPSCVPLWVGLFGVFYGMRRS